MAITQLGRYLAGQQRDREHIHGDFLAGSLVSDYWQVNEKVGVTMTVGMKQRWVGSAFYVVGAGADGSQYGWVDSTGTGYYVTGEGYGMGEWGFVESGTS